MRSLFADAKCPSTIKALISHFERMTLCGLFCDEATARCLKERMSLGGGLISGAGNRCIVVDRFDCLKRFVTYRQWLG